MEELEKGEDYEGIWRETDGMNKGMDDGEKHGCKGLARMIKKNTEGKWGDRIRKDKKDKIWKKEKWESEMMERIGQEKEKQARREGCSVGKWGANSENGCE